MSSSADSLLRVIFEAPLENNPAQGLAVALVGRGQVLLQINDDEGTHSVLLPHRGAVGLVLALCESIVPTAEDLARFRASIDTAWQRLPVETA